jgi:hypothetical protein
MRDRLYTPDLIRGALRRGYPITVSEIVEQLLMQGDPRSRTAVANNLRTMSDVERIKGSGPRGADCYRLKENR